MSDHQATAIVHWPGSDTAACDEHRRQLAILNSFMGGPKLAESPLTTPTECDNCVNEAAKEV